MCPSTIGWRRAWVYVAHWMLWSSSSSYIARPPRLESFGAGRGLVAAVVDDLGAAVLLDVLLDLVPDAAHVVHAPQHDGAQQERADGGDDGPGPHPGPEDEP